MPLEIGHLYFKCSQSYPKQQWLKTGFAHIEKFYLLSIYLSTIFSYPHCDHTEKKKKLILTPWESMPLKSDFTADDIFEIKRKL